MWFSPVSLRLHWMTLAPLAREYWNVGLPG
jgi:hypothetical protein